MSLGWRLSKQHRTDLVCGYLRNNDANLPKELHKICLLFYDVIIDWKIEETDFQMFFSLDKKYKIHMKGPSFVIKQIPFDLKLYPNGEIPLHEGYVQFVLFTGRPLPQHILSYRVYLELFCFETKYQFRKVIDCGHAYHACQWYRLSTSLDNLKGKNYKGLNLGCVVEILNIKYDEKYAISKYIRPIKMNVHSKFEWNITKTELELFKSSDVDSSLYSANFNGGCWCIVFIPYGWSWSEKTKNHMFAKIKLLKLPFGIKSIDIDAVFVIKSYKHTIGWIYSKKCSIRQPGKVDMEQKINVNKFKKCKDNLTISATMRIVRVYDDNDQEIDKNKWSNYGVFENVNINNVFASSL